MKKISNKVKVLILLIVAIIIAGIVVSLTIGFNFSLEYQNTKKIELNLNQEFREKDIKQIANEVMPNQPVLIQKVEVFEDVASIISNDITDEQKNNIVNKVNEKYQTELKADEIEIQSIPHTRGRDIIKHYIMPFVISTIIILVYVAIRYYKLGSFKVLLKSAILLVVTQVVLFSLIAITRIPIGKLTIPMVLIVYILSLMQITTTGEHKLSLIKQEENTNKKTKK